MGVFYASLAQSADAWLVERSQYQVGADLTFEQAVYKDDTRTSTTPRATWLPLNVYESIPGVARATRVGVFSASIPAMRDLPKLRLVAVDRLSFPDVAHFRHDLASRPLGELMNQLGRVDRAILLPTKIAGRLQVKEGDELPVGLYLGEEWYEFRYTVVGTFDHFPTMLDDKTDLVVVTSMGFLQRELGSFPHNIWLRLDSGAESAPVLAAIEGLGVIPQAAGDLPKLLADDQQRPERVGIYGMLTVSFLAGGLLAAATLLLQSAASVRQRAHQFALLRAIGMRASEITFLALIEYLVTVLFGMVTGTGIGIVCADLYVRYFPLAMDGQPQRPPFLSLTDWSAALWLAVSMSGLLVVLGALAAWAANRTRMFEALRLGLRE